MHDIYNYWVYIVKCKDDKYYTGVTNDLDRRLQGHNEGVNPQCYTYERRPVQLMYEEHFHDINQAIAWEKQLKGWSRKKKEALFRRDVEEIKRLAKSKITGRIMIHLILILRQAQDDNVVGLYYKNKKGFADFNNEAFAMKRNYTNPLQLF